MRTGFLSASSTGRGSALLLGVVMSLASRALPERSVRLVKMIDRHGARKAIGQHPWRNDPALPPDLSDIEASVGVPS